MEIDRSLIFWNIAGLGNKDEEFWKYIKRFDFISLNETWIEEKGWERMKEKMPKTHEWAYSFSKKSKKKGRAKGGFIIGKRVGWGKQEVY